MLEVCTIVAEVCSDCDMAYYDGPTILKIEKRNVDKIVAIDLELKFKKFKELVDILEDATGGYSVITHKKKHSTYADVLNLGKELFLM